MYDYDTVTFWSEANKYVKYNNTAKILLLIFITGGRMH